MAFSYNFCYPFQNPLPEDPRIFTLCSISVEQYNKWNSRLTADRLKNKLWVKFVRKFHTCAEQVCATSQKRQMAKTGSCLKDGENICVYVCVLVGALSKSC